MEDLTDDQTIELGRFCEALKLHPQFNVLIKQFELQIVHGICATEPHEQKKREGIYASFCGVRDLLAHMDTVAMQAVKLTTPEAPAVSEFDPQTEDLD